MPYFVISNFANGRDLRRSSETAPSGTLRILRNAFVNEGGQIEKRRAWVKQTALSDYANDPLRKGRVIGPMRCPNCPSTAFFRHRGADLPGAPFAAGTKGNTALYEAINPDTGDWTQRYWVQASLEPMPGSAALARAHAFSEFSSNAYAVESFVDPITRRMRFQHIYIPHDGSEPDGEILVTANDTRPAQTILRSKSYVASGNSLFASAIGDPADMAGTGAGVVDLTNQGMPIGQAVALSEYFGQLVVFGSRGVMFWSVDPDFAQNQYLRSIEASIFAPRTAVPYGSGDVLFLTRGGVRSLQARDSSNEARISDVGSPIDLEVRRVLDLDLEDSEPLFSDALSNVNNREFYNVAHGIIHHDTGQFWLAVRDKVHVLTRYPSAKVLAWATFDLPEVTNGAGEGPNGILKGQWVADWCEIDQSIIMRNFADEVYLYGGQTGVEFDDSEVEVTTPFMDMGRAGSTKHFRGVDIVCDGDWMVQFATIDPGEDRIINWQDIGIARGSTRAKPKMAFDAAGTQIALRLICKEGGRAGLSEIVVHYNEGAQK